MVEGVGEVRGDQDQTHHYYNIALRGVKLVESCPVEGLDTRDELTEEHGTSALIPQ